MKLADLQNKFIDALYLGEDSHLYGEIVDGKVAKDKLFNIYRQNLFLGLINVLRITYPKIYQILGEQEFSRLSREYIANTRSESANLDNYGESFSIFLEKKDEGFLSDLARLSWFEQESFLTKDTKKIDIEALQSLTEEQLSRVRFVLNPNCRLFSSYYNLLIRGRRGPRNKNQNFFEVFCFADEVYVNKVSKSEYIFLSEMQNGLGLYDIYEKHHINIQNFLPKYIANGVLSDFFLGDL